MVEGFAFFGSFKQKVICLVASLRTLVTLVLKSNPKELVTFNQCWAGVLSSFEGFKNKIKIPN
jgi:hypothetical protein